MDANLNKKEQWAVDYISSHILDEHKKELGYEFKNFDIKVDETYHRRVYLTATVGLKGDEGTLAEALARDRFMFVIGNQGGISTFVTKKNGKDMTWKSGYHWSPLR